MLLLVDVFQYLSVVVHALVIMAQSMTIGGSLFLVFLAQPFAVRLTVPVATPELPGPVVTAQGGDRVRAERYRAC